MSITVMSLVLIKQKKLQGSLCLMHLSDACMLVIIIYDYAIFET